jgi:BirA family biotin operon repressor/biotin-[acetyl-CoA-carboxylase] ligase
MKTRLEKKFSQDLIKGLDTKIIGKKIFHFDTIDSTNIYAKKLAKEGIEEGVIIFADVQTSGRGRKNRLWSSPKGGLWFSVVLYPNISPKKAMLLTMASSIAVFQGIKKITGIKAEIKWPNDLLINGRKICGILTEIDSEKQKINYCIIGIGINVNNELEKELQLDATTLKKELNKEILIHELLRAIIENFDENYNKLLSGEYDFIRESWLKCSNIIGRKIQVIDDKTVLTGKVVKVDSDGYILLNTANGEIKIISGDIKYL